MLDPKHYEDAHILGYVTCTISEIFLTSPALSALVYSCAISIDRRMTVGETRLSCLKEIEDLPAVKKYGKDVKVTINRDDQPSWTGEVYKTNCFFPPGSTVRKPPSLGHWWTTTTP